MNCIQCGAEMKTARENYLYDANDLKVTLLDVEVSRCSACGEYEVAIPMIDDLNRGIAAALIRKRSRLVAGEVRFLRKYLGWSGTDFAAHMGVTPETVSRWEQGAMPMGATADRLLRLMIVTRQPVSDYSLDSLKQLSADEAQPIRLGMKVTAQGWLAEAA